jgi:hypothetical protein
MSEQEVGVRVGTRTGQREKTQECLHSFILRDKSAQVRSVLATEMDVMGDGAV